MGLLRKNAPSVRNIYLTSRGSNLYDEKIGKGWKQGKDERARADMNKKTVKMRGHGHALWHRVVVANLYNKNRSAAKVVQLCQKAQVYYAKSLLRYF